MQTDTVVYSTRMDWLVPEADIRAPAVRAHDPLLYLSLTSGQCLAVQDPVRIQYFIPEPTVYFACTGSSPPSSRGHIFLSSRFCSSPLERILMVNFFV